jgi:hypothetical protein
VLQDAMPFRLAMKQHNQGDESYSVVCMECRTPEQALDERRLALEVDSNGACSGRLLECAKATANPAFPIISYAAR